MKLTTLLSSVLIACAPVAAQSPTIDRLAPKNTILIVGTNNFQNAYQHFNATTLPQIFEMQPFKEMQAEMEQAGGDLGEYEELMDRIFEELGIEEQPERAMPTGAAGLAVYVHTLDDASRRPGVFAFADYGDHAETVQTIMDRLLEKMDEDDAAEYEIEDVLGRRVYSFTTPEGSDDLDDAMDKVDPGMGLPPGLPTPDLEKMFEGMKTVHVARDGDVYYISSELMQLTESFALLDEHGATAFADSDDYLGLRAQLGSDNDLYGMMFVRPIFRMLAEADPGTAMMQGMLVSIIGDIKGIGMGMRMDGRTAMIEGSMGIYMPGGKSGLTMLLDRPGPRGDLPAFVGPNAVSFSAMNFDMSGFADFVMGFIRGNPFLAQQMGQDTMPMIEDTLNSLSDALGNQLYTVQTLERPITVQNVGPMMAVRCTDPQKLENTVSQFAPQMGMQPRDFLGNRIFSMDPQMAAMMGGAGMPAIGIGGGYMFVGMEPIVQQALRSAGQADQPTLSGEPAFDRAVNALSEDDVIAWGFTDVGPAMEMQMKSMKLQQQQQIEQMRQWDPEFADEMARDMADPTKHWDDDDWTRLRELIGPQVYEMRSTDTGFVMRFFQHRGMPQQ